MDKCNCERIKRAALGDNRRMIYNTQLTCDICGKTFAQTENWKGKIYCSDECRRQKERDRDRQRKRCSRTSISTKTKRKLKENSAALQKINNEAIKNKMSYGAFVMQKFVKDDEEDFQKRKAEWMKQQKEKE